MASVLRAPSPDRVDRALLQSALDGHLLPPYVPGEPSDMAAATGAAQLAPAVLRALRAEHGLDKWDADAFERVFLGRAMRAWHGALAIEHRPNTLVVRAATCPVREEAARDARVCQLCRALRTMAAQEAYGRRLHGVTFPQLITRGDAACEMHVAVGRGES